MLKFTVIGSETNATLLSGALYNLAKHPVVLERLLAEIKKVSLDGKTVNMTDVHSLPYLNAVLEECLRIYPPSAFNQARVVPKEGAIICGIPVPAGTAVGVATYAASLSEKNWTDAATFLPERWLGDQLPGDDRKAMQPFLVGPRNCLGKKLVSPVISSIY